MFELGFEGGTLVSATGRARLNVYVSNGRIAAVSGHREPAAQVIDASGLLVMPGMVDTHVHLMDPAEPSREDFPRGTAAAARAGVTTVIEHTHAGPVRNAEDLEEKRRYLADRSRVDYALAAHAWPDRIEEVESLWRGGVAFFKVFTCTTHGVPGFEPAKLRQLFQRVAAADALCLVHCEDESMTGAAYEELRSSGRADGSVIPEWRHLDAELFALMSTTFLARRTGAQIIAAHVSSPAGLEIIQRERAAGARVLAEGCPQYLTLLEEEVMVAGSCRKFTPPARARTAAELAEMWRALRDGRINHIGTDHAPSTLEQKAGSIWDAPFGLPGLDTTLPVLLNAASEGLISYERLVEVYSTAPAKAYRLFPTKGHLGIGADADLILVDPEQVWKVSDSEILSGAKWSPFSGRSLTGRAVQTYLRGTLICDEGKVVAEPGRGVFIPGAGKTRI